MNNVTTIEQVIAANEELAIAIEQYSSAFQKPVFKGMSLALEEAVDDGKQEAKVGILEKLKALINRLIDWAKGLFTRNKEANQQKLEAVMQGDGKQSYDELLKTLEDKYSEYRQVAMSTVAPAVRSHLISAAVEMVNEDKACIVMLRCGGPAKYVEECRRTAREYINSFKQLIDGLSNIMQGNTYRESIVINGFMTGIKDVGMPLTVQEYPSLVRGDKTAARAILFEAAEGLKEFKQAIEMAEQFQVRANRLLTDAAKSQDKYDVNDIKRLAADVAEFIPTAIKSLTMANQTGYSAFMSCVEVNKILYGRSSVIKNIPTEELVTLMGKVMQNTGKGAKEITHEFMNGLITYTAVLLGPDIEIIKG